MEIIKQGQKPEEKKTLKTCENCKCEFAYVKSDVKPDQRDGDYVICPCCGKWINI